MEKEPPPPSSSMNKAAEEPPEVAPPMFSPAIAQHLQSLGTIIAEGKRRRDAAFLNEGERQKWQELYEMHYAGLDEEFLRLVDIKKTQKQQFEALYWLHRKEGMDKETATQRAREDLNIPHNVENYRSRFPAEHVSTIDEYQYQATKHSERIKELIHAVHNAKLEFQTASARADTYMLTGNQQYDMIQVNALDVEKNSARKKLEKLEQFLARKRATTATWYLGIPKAIRKHIIVDFTDEWSHVREQALQPGLMVPALEGPIERYPTSAMNVQRPVEDIQQRYREIVGEEREGDQIEIDLDKFDNDEMEKGNEYAGLVMDKKAAKKRQERVIEAMKSFDEMMERAAAGEWSPPAKLLQKIEEMSEKLEQYDVEWEQYQKDLEAKRNAKREKIRAEGNVVASKKRKKRQVLEESSDEEDTDATGPTPPLSDREYRKYEDYIVRLFNSYLAQITKRIRKT